MIRKLQKRVTMAVIPLLIIFSLFLILQLIVNLRADQVYREHLVSSQVANLGNHLQLAEEMEVLRRKHVMILSDQLEPALSESNVIRSEARTRSGVENRSSSIQSSLFHHHEFNKNLDVPGVLNYLPHLLGHRHALEPALHVSSGRRQVSLVLGIPTVRRSVQSYLMATLQDLVDNMSGEERQDTLIVVLIADADLEYCKRLASQIQNRFGDEVTSGLMDIISPRSEYYPALDKVQSTLDDSVDRVRWRTKQNLDFAFLMMYCRPRGVAYVQLEDDIVSKKGYISAMNKFVLEKTSSHPNWLVLDFCQLGFIGKLFRCKDLLLLINYLIMFHSDKPCDWLLVDLVKTKVCRLDQKPKDCSIEVNKVWLRDKESLFQHMGVHSSLKGKLQKLKDKTFGKTKDLNKYRNPPASVVSTISTYKMYTLKRAYAGETFYWGLTAKANDTLTFKFSKPIKLIGYLFRSGSSDHPKDIFYNTSVQVLPATATSSQPSNWITKGEFNSRGLAEAKWSLSSAVHVSAVRLLVNRNSSKWVILSEIQIRTI